MRYRCLAAIAAFFAVLLIAADAGATTRAVAIMNFGFSPGTVTVAQGTTVKWTQMDVGVQHTSTSNQGFWSSARMNSGQSFSAAFHNAGTFGYHCMVHPDMTGAVRVPMTATGSSSTGWTLRWTNLSSVPSTIAFDVQIEKPGTTAFVAFRTAVTARTAAFNPAHNGTYRFRARTKNLSNGKNSGWSPTKSVAIT